MSFNNGYYFFEHTGDQSHGYVMFRISGATVRVQILIEDLTAPTDEKCSVYLSNENDDKLFLVDIPLKKLRNGKKTGSADFKYDKRSKPTLDDFDCIHVVIRNRSVMEAFSGKTRQFTRDLFTDNRKIATKVEPASQKKPDNIQNVYEVKPNTNTEDIQDNKLKQLPVLEKKQAPVRETRPESKVTSEQKPDNAKVQEKHDEVKTPSKQKWEWDEKNYSTLKDNYSDKMNELTIDEVFDSKLVPFDPFNTTNKAYTWWIADNYNIADAALKSVNVTIPSIISRFLYNNIENYKHALIGRYIQDKRYFVILGIPSEKYVANTVARWMKCSVAYNNTAYSGYLLYYIDANTSSLVKAVQAE